jgi:nitrogen-specific signal transduction histidine kinase
MPNHMLCAAYDINDYKRNEEALRNQEVQDALFRLISLISYEINTPLANIKNILFLLRTSASDQSDIRYLQWMEEEIERLARIPRRLSTLPVANS